MVEKLSPEQQTKLKSFDPTKPLVINAAEIPGLESLVGKFVFKRPTAKERLQIGIISNKLKEGEQLDTLHDNLAYILATFQVVCTEKPQGFDFENSYELDPIFAIFDQYSQWINFFRQQFPTTKTATS